MPLLLGYVANDFRQVGLADRKARVTALPLKIQVIAALFFEPQVGDPLDFLYPFGLGNRASEAAQQMDVVFHAADLQRRALQLFGNRAKVRVQGLPKDTVAQKRPALLYAYVRRKGYSAPDAQDLTQEFFARLLARNYVAGADR